MLVMRQVFTTGAKLTLMTSSSIRETCDWTASVWSVEREEDLVIDVTIPGSVVTELSWFPKTFFVPVAVFSQSTPSN
jgi:hypothetical protein